MSEWKEQNQDVIYGANKDGKVIPRTFLGKAYLVELERGTYGLYRNLEMNTDQMGEDGQPVREKIKAIGPIKLLRLAQEGEENLVVMRTFDEVAHRELKLVEV